MCAHCRYAADTAAAAEAGGLAPQPGGVAAGSSGLEGKLGRLGLQDSAGAAMHLGVMQGEPPGGTLPGMYGAD